MASVLLAIVLLTLETETNLNRSKLSHLHLSSCDTLIIHYISANARKKNRKKKRFFGMLFGTGFAVPAILAETAAFLPFWQLTPPYGGEFAVSLPSRGLGSRNKSGLPVILLGFHPHRLTMFFAS